MNYVNQSLAFLILIYSSLIHCAELSPHGTGFIQGSKQDLEIRLEWAKKDPCFNHGFDPVSMEALELKKYWAMKNGPNSSSPKCKNSKSLTKTQGDLSRN